MAATGEMADRDCKTAKMVPGRLLHLTKGK